MIIIIINRDANPTERDVCLYQDLKKKCKIQVLQLFSICRLYNPNSYPQLARFRAVLIIS